MAISNSCVIKEWAPLTDLLNKIPTKPNLSIFSGDVKITCIDVLAEFIALGTNYGMAYWYDRKNKELQRLRCENSSVPITSIKVLSTVDYMLACGSNIGNISIFQIPKVHPDWIPENLKPKKKSVERYTVSDLHKTAITALEWSKNGMKLFSGDKNGTIVLTEIDFYLHICKSLEILNESYEIVQLSYNNPILIISTTYRSIICEWSDKWNVVQIGQKDRKILGEFGGIVKQNRFINKKPVIYSTRPGFRIWVSDSQGNVQKTLLFKEILSKECAEVVLLNPASRPLQGSPSRELNFGRVLPFEENLLVTYNKHMVYILDPQEMTVVAKISHLRRVLDVACHNDEIFILEEDRSLLRVSTRPDPNYESITPLEHSVFPYSLRDLTSKLHTSSILSSIPPVIEQAFTYNINEHTDGEIIVNAEEAMETVSENTSNVESPNRFENIIDEEDIGDIIYKHKRHRKKNQDKDKVVSTSCSSQSSTEDNIIRPTIMNLSTVGALPDLRSPKSIQNDIEYKEKILADVLNFDKKISLDLGKSEKPSQNETILGDFLNLDKKISVDVVKPGEALQNEKILADVSNDKISLDVVEPKQPPVIKEQISNYRCRDDEAKTSKTTSRMKNSDSAKFVRQKSREETKAIPIKSKKTETPDCVNIPNGWNLSSVKVRKESSSSSLSDWEVL